MRDCGWDIVDRRMRDPGMVGVLLFRYPRALKLPLSELFLDVFGLVPALPWSLFIRSIQEYKLVVDT